MITSEAEARSWLAQLPEWNAEAAGRLEQLVALLVEENVRQNLVSAASLDAVWLRHVVDSAQLICLVPRETGSPWLDLGTGAGFPGLVIAALRPECEVLMIESRARRAEWLERARIALGLQRAKIVAARLELQDVAGIARKALTLAAWVHDDQLGAALGGILQESCSDGVVLGGTGADDDDAVAVLGSREWRRDGA